MSRSWSRSTSRRIAAAVAAGGIAALALFNGPAGAAGSTVKCTARSQSPVFGKWGDLSDYFLLPDGGFEVGNEWVLTNGASIVTGNESWNVRAATDSKSLRLPTYSSAEGRTVCVAKGEETVRLFVKNPGVWGAWLRISIGVKNPANGLWNTSYFDLPSTGLPVGWTPTTSLNIPTTWGYTGQQEMTVTISAWGMPATWQVDDVYVDPFRST